MVNLGDVFVVFDNKTGTLFAGEAAGNYHEEIDVYTPAAPPPAFDPEDSIRSYEVIRALNPTALLYSHCGLITDVERALSEAAESAKGMGEVALAALKAGGDKEEDRPLHGIYFLNERHHFVQNIHVVFRNSGVNLHAQTHGLGAV